MNLGFFSCFFTAPFTTANDNESQPGRNPKSWTLYGCNDYSSSAKEGSWTSLHTVTDDTTMEDKNFTSYSFSFSNTEKYTYYKLEITANRGANFMQLSEMTLTCSESTVTNFPAVYLSTEVMANPDSTATDKWTGSYVYFGKYNGNAMKFRVLQKSTDTFSSGTNTLFLDCDNVLYTAQMDTANQTGPSALWGNADNTLSKELNSSQKLNSMFASPELAAIIKSNKTSKSDLDGKDYQSNSGIFRPTNNTYLFPLEYQELLGSNYGYDSSNYNRKKKDLSGNDSAYWTRGRINSNKESNYYVTTDGTLKRYFATENCGVSPALNIKLSQIMFVSTVSGTIRNYNTEYKLTVKDSKMTVAANGEALLYGNSIAIPYKITGDNASAANSLSLLVLDGAYSSENSSNAAVKYYKQITLSKTSGTANMEIPDSEIIKNICNETYYAYILAEDINGTYETDFCSAPVRITPKYAITFNPGSNGSGNAQTIYKAYGESITLKNGIYTRSGYFQTGWATSDGGAEVYNLGASYAADSPVTLYPVWSETADIELTYTGDITGTTTLNRVKTSDKVISLLSDFKPQTGYYRWFYNGKPVTADMTFGDIFGNTEFTGKLTLSCTNKTTVDSEDELLYALESGVNPVVLGADITLSANINMPSSHKYADSPNAYITLDLNGFILDGTAIINAEDSNIELKDSAPLATHSDSSLPVGGIIGSGIQISVHTNNYLSYLYANGGTVLGKVYMDSQCYISGTENAVTVFMSPVYCYENTIEKGIFYGGIVYAGPLVYITAENCISSGTSYFTASFETYGRSPVATQYFVGVTSAKIYKPANPSINANEVNTVFSGWFDSSNDNSFDFETPITQNTVIYAGFEKTVTNEEELVSALTDDKIPFIKLGAEITVTTDIEISGTIRNINLNGYCLKGSGKKLTVTGNLTFTNGTVFCDIILSSECTLSGDVFRGEVDNKIRSSINKGIFLGGITETTINANFNSNTFRVVFYYTEAGKTANRIYHYYVDPSSDIKYYQPETPSQENCTFLGWYNGDDKFDFNTSVASASSKKISLTTHWEAHVSDYEEFETALSYASGIILENDIECPSGTDTFTVFKTYLTILDLNGFVLKGALKLKILSDFEITDSNPSAVHSDSSLPNGGIIAETVLIYTSDSYTSGGSSTDTTFDTSLNTSQDIPIINPTITIEVNPVLYANGGTVYANITLSSNCNLYSDGENPTVFSGTVSNAGTLSGGKYLCAVTNTGTITKGSFYSGITGSGTVSGNRYTVSFDSASGSPAAQQIFVGYRTGKAMQPSAVTKDGYKFAGWFDEGKLFNFDAVIRRDITLTAEWRKPGDTNGDDSIDIIDLVRMKKHIANASALSHADAVGADLDNDNAVDSKDMVLLRKILLGIS